jgi:hypothetical protein
MREPRFLPALVLLAACGGGADLGGLPSTCDGGRLDANAAESGVDALVADAVSVATIASDASDAEEANDANDGASQQAAPSSCGDHVKDGNETDIDCGGSCPPCAIGQACLVSGDCGYAPGCSPTRGCACDAVSLTCVFDHCFDHKKDGSETDVDCGDPVDGCTGCAVGRTCLVDGDCASRGCDATSSSCAQTQCGDHHRDGLETDVDCGGVVCPECVPGQGCRVNADCTTAACDLLAFSCVQDPCADHRQDGTETDADCGGSVCVARCQPGQHCLSNFDCVGGHFCNGARACQ